MEPCFPCIVRGNFLGVERARKLKRLLVAFPFGTVVDSPEGVSSTGFDGFFLVLEIRLNNRVDCFLSATLDTSFDSPGASASRFELFFLGI